MLEVVSALVFAKLIEDGTTELPEKCCLPATTRDFPNQPRTRLRTTVTPRHIGFGQRFIDKDNTGRIDQFLGITPLDAFLCDIRTILPMSNSPGDPSNTLVPRGMLSRFRPGLYCMPSADSRQKPRHRTTAHGPRIHSARQRCFAPHASMARPRRCGPECSKSDGGSEDHRARMECRTMAVACHQ